MPYLSREELEQIGLRVTAGYRRLLASAGAGALRVDISLLVRELLGLKVEYHHLSRSGDTLGVTSFCEVGVEVFDQEGSQYAELDGRTIFVESDLLREDAVPGRRNFTLAHEGSHHILKRLFPGEYGVRYRRGGLRILRRDAANGTAPDWEEWQANALAAAILLPAGNVRTAMAEYGLGERMRRLNRVFDPVEYERFAAMAGYLGVSRAALSIRMTQLGLLEQNYLGRPYDLVDITMDKEGAG